MSVERDYRITISATLGRGMSAAMTDFVAEATRAKAKVDEILAKPNKGAAKAAAELAKIREKENDAILKDVAKHEKAQEKAQAKIAKIKERYFQEEQRRGEKADAERERRNEKIASSAMGYMRKAAAVAGRVAGEVASGFGIDTSISGWVQRAVERDTLARNISAQAFRGRPGEVAEDPEELQRLAQTVGEKYKIDPGKALGGLGKFQALTGDLETGKAALDGLAKLAKGFGVDLDQMVGAAGQISSALGDVGEGKAFATAGEKAAELNRIMRAGTAQTQEGAIEMSDFVSQYAKLKGAGIRFEGNTGDNILKMSALAQMAYQTGGAGSVSQASNAVMGFTNTLATKARRDAFKAQGVEIDSKEAGKFVDPYEIIKRALKATGGDTDKMKAMFGNVLGEKAVNALSGAFRGAGGGDKGLAAIDALTAKFGGTITDAQLEKNLSTQMGSKASQAQEIQNELDKVASTFATDVTPALKQLAPVAVDVAKGLASVATTAANHPWGTVAAVIGGSIAAAVAKEAIGEVAGKALASGLSNLGGKGLAVGALTVAAVTAYLYLKKTFDEAAEGQSKGVGTQVSAEATSQLARDVAAGRVSKEEALKKMEETYATGSKQVKLAEKGVGLLDYVNPFGDATNAELGAAQELAAGQENGAKVGGKTELEALKANMAAVKDSIDSLKTQMAADAQTTKKVMVVNQAPGAPTGGTVAQ